MLSSASFKSSRRFSSTNYSKTVAKISRGDLPSSQPPVLMICSESPGSLSFSSPPSSSLVCLPSVTRAASLASSKRMESARIANSTSMSSVPSALIGQPVRSANVATSLTTESASSALTGLVRTATSAQLVAAPLAKRAGSSAMVSAVSADSLKAAS